MQQERCRHSGPDPNLPNQDEQCNAPGSARSNLASVSLFSFSLLNEKRKRVFKTPSQPWVAGSALPGAEERQLCHCLSFLLHFCYFNTTTQITLQQGDPAGRFQVTCKEEIIFILCGLFLNCTDYEPSGKRADGISCNLETKIIIIRLKIIS